MIDRLRQMAIFAKVIDHGSFRGAARALRLSPSVVSHHVSQLEEHLGVALIYRTTRKLTLTEEGARLLRATRTMLDAAEGELAALAGAARQPSGELALTLPSVLSQSPITERIAAFTAAYPRVALSLDFSDTRRALIADGFDLAIRMGPKVKRSPASRTLFRAPRRAVAAAAYLAARPAAAAPQDLMDWDWLSLTPAETVPLVFRRGGGDPVALKPPSRLSTNDAQALYRLARAGAGVAVVPAFLAEADVAAGRMAYVPPDWTLNPVDVFAVWPANAPKHGLIHLLLDALGRDPDLGA